MSYIFVQWHDYYMTNTWLSFLLRVTRCNELIELEQYYAMTHAMKEALWICLFLMIHKLPVPWPFPLLCNNQSVLALIKSKAISSWSKHINIHFFFFWVKFKSIWAEPHVRPYNLMSTLPKALMPFLTALIPHHQHGSRVALIVFWHFWLMKSSSSKYPITSDRHGIEES